MPDLRSQLAEYLDEVVQRVDADELLQTPVVGGTRKRSSSKPTGVMAGFVYALAAAAFVLLIIGIGGYIAGRPLEPAAFLVDGSVGLHGLPPENAIPSTPFEGELVANMWAHFESDEWFSLYLYRDGRLIWLDGADPNTTTGWVEQRLTPEGVALVHDEIVATGLFDPDNPGEPKSLPAIGYIQVRIDDQLVVRWGRTVMDDPIRDRLLGLQSWLPANAWKEPEPRMYVPLSYGVCLEYSGTFVPAEPAEQLAALPAEAQELLAAARHYRGAEIGEADPVVAATWYSPHCFEVSTEQARTLVEIFNAAGLEGGYSDIRLAFETSSGLPRVYVPIVPFMPHGAPG